MAHTPFGYQLSTLDSACPETRESGDWRRSPNRTVQTVRNGNADRRARSLGSRLRHAAQDLVDEFVRIRILATVSQFIVRRAKR